MWRLLAQIWAHSLSEQRDRWEERLKVKDRHTDIQINRPINLCTVDTVTGRLSLFLKQSCSALCNHSHTYTHSQLIWMLCKSPYGEKLLPSSSAQPEPALSACHLFMTMFHRNEAEETLKSFSLLISETSALQDKSQWQMRQKRVTD